MNTQMLNLCLSFIITIVLGIIIVPILKKFKIGQIERKEGPKEHLKKSGTPTMGGIMIVIALVLILAFNSITNKELLLAIVPILGFGFVGFLDDCSTIGFMCLFAL